MRCFVGIELPEAVRYACIDAAEAVRIADPTWAAEKWVPAENLHVTVRFLGDVDDALLTPLIEALGVCCASAVPFELIPRPLMAVPLQGRARMLWLPFADPTGTALALAQSVGFAAGPFTVAATQATFAAHVTLVRARHGRAIDSAVLREAWRAGRIGEVRAMSVPSATLFASTLTSRGPIYTVLAHWLLGEGTAVNGRPMGSREKGV